MIDAVKLLRDLVSVPSVNPAFAEPGSPNTCERGVAQLIAHLARRGGLDTELREVLPRRPNVFVRLAPVGRARQRLLLVPHMDTVNAADSAFKPRVACGRLTGRGACDTKGSIAAMLAALLELAGNRQRPRETEIVLVGVIDEENAQAGSRALVEDGMRADLAIIGEPTRLQVVTAHKGNLWLRLTTRGKSAHGSRPELGHNAIHSMARIVDLLETAYADRLRRRRHPLLGHPTVNVGTIEGGLQPNIVPARCAISVDRRTLPGETAASVGREIRAFLAQHKLSATLMDDKAAPCLPLETDPRLPLVRLFMRAARQRRPTGVNFFCDAAVLAAGGIPSVVFGPGDIAQAHTADEWISVKSLERAKDILVHYFKSLA
jgi:acetylornithine deacetylase/succinyl-diaminopimelate desuccinylase family protein